MKENEPGEPARPKSPETSTLYERIVESAIGFAIFTQDLHGLVTSWNAGAERLLGYEADEILGRSAEVIFVPEDQAAGAPDAERAKALAEGRAEDERWHVRRDGSRFWGSGLLMPLRDQRSGLVKILRDLSEHHAAEQRLRESEALFRVLATNIPQLVFRSRVTGERIWGSPQWVDFTGLDLEHSLEFGWLEAIHPEDREPTLAAWRAAEETGTYYVEHRILRSAGGDYRWHQTRARPIGTGSGAVGEWIGTSTDIHDMRGLQERQGVLLAELQHRTRNLLAVVQAIARRTLRTSASLEAFGAEFEERLGALGRVQSLLARADDHALDLNALIGAELAAHGGGRGKADKMHIEGPRITVSAGAAQALALALHELATNAMKYGALAQPEGRLAVTWQLEEEKERRIVLDWRENGVAMPEGGPNRKGYGRELIERALPYQLKAKTQLEFGTDGVHCRITVPVAAIGRAAGHG
jgi:PAS domain S-box-containing protein